MKEKFTIHRTVGPSHLDSEGQLSIRSLVDFMQDCSIFQLDSEPELAKYFAETNSGMFLSQRQIDILRLPRHGEELIVKTWVYKRNPSYGYRNTNVYDQNGEPCVLSSSMGVFVDYSKGTIIRVPTEVMDTVPVYEPCEMEYLPRKIAKVRYLEVEKCEPFYVWKFMIDANNHVNNARYISLAQEYLPDGYVFRRIRVEYLIAAKQGEYIYPHVYKRPDGACLVCLKSEEGKNYAVVEFS